MKNFFIYLFSPLKQERALIFPFLLFLASLTFITISSSIAIYQNHLSYTDYAQEQIKIETLLQMGVRQFFREEIESISPPGSKVYLYPYGTVTVAYTVNGEYLILKYLVQTNENAKYRTEKVLSLQDF